MSDNISTSTNPYRDAGLNLLVMEKWMDLDLARQDGKLSYVQVVEEFNTFMKPVGGLCLVTGMAAALMGEAETLVEAIEDAEVRHGQMSERLSEVLGDL
jgi:hypothetical protein